MNSKSIIALIAVFATVLIGSVILGFAVGTSDFQTIGGFLLIFAAVAAFLLLGRNVWVLIPTFALWSGGIMILPIPFSVANIAVAFSLGCWLILLVTRRVHFRYQMDSIDGWLLALLAVLMVGYIRNPVGIASFATGGNVGARPYFEVGMAFCAYVMLSSMTSSSKVIRRLPYAVIGSTFVIAVGGSISYFLPQVGLYLYPFYSGFLPDIKALDPSLPVNVDSIGRASFLVPFVLSVCLYLFASKPPVLNLNPLNPIRFIVLLAAVVLSMLSGFRGSVAAIGMYFVIGSILWWKGRGLILCAMLFIIGSISIVAIQATVKLPDRLQRSVAFLPGNWDDHVIRSAKESNQWRLDMWSEIMEGDGIKNWWIGDGFGFPAAELAYYSELQKKGKITPEQLADYYLMTGDLHSGPLSAIKFVGVVGLVCFVVLSIVISIKYVKLWRFAKGHEAKSSVGYYAIYSCYFPIVYIFVYGAFQTDLPSLIVSAGLLKLLDRSVRSCHNDRNVAQLQ